jgi:hypothetical protein
MRFTKLINERLKVYGEAELPDAAMPIEPDTFIKNDIKSTAVDDMQADEDRKVKAIIKNALDVVKNLSLVFKDKFSTQLGQGDPIIVQLDRLIDVSSAITDEDATPDKLNDIQAVIRDIKPEVEI